MGSSCDEADEGEEHIEEEEEEQEQDDWNEIAQIQEEGVEDEEDQDLSKASDVIVANAKVVHLRLASVLHAHAQTDDAESAVQVGDAVRSL